MICFLNRSPFHEEGIIDTLMNRGRQVILGVSRRLAGRAARFNLYYTTFRKGFSLASLTQVYSKL